ncbi:MAG: hypothetical protein WC453_03830 [Patescibacteria group bacterium]
MSVTNQDNDFDRKLVAKIKAEKISPKPRWHFLLKDSVIWAAGTFSLLVGAGAVSVLIYFFKYSGWEMREAMHKSWGEFFLLTLPYFWIIFLGLFVFILYYNLQHTKHGYRYPVWFIISSSVLSSVILGGIFFLAGLGERIDNLLGVQAPFYNTVINRHLDFWFNPAEGRLVGIVTDKNDDNSFTIIDPSGNEWLVSADSCASSMFLLHLREPVDIIGQVTDDHRFAARRIKPGHPGRSFLSRPRPRPSRTNLPPLLLPSP